MRSTTGGSLALGASLGGLLVLSLTSCEGDDGRGGPAGGLATNGEMATSGDSGGANPGGAGTTGTDAVGSDDTAGAEGPIFDVGHATGGAVDEGGTICDEVHLIAEPRIPTVQLVIDQSSSMLTGFGGTNRWLAVYQTLMDPATGVVTQLQGDVRFGLTLYSSQSGFAGGMCPMTSTVAAEFDNHAAIDAVWSAAVPIDDTPTGDTVSEVTPLLVADPFVGRKYIVLATDGEPDTCAQPDPNQGQDQALASVQSAFGLGLETFILSVGSEIGAAHLQQMANAGVGLDPLGAENAPYYQALDPVQLLDAFLEILASVASCSFEIEGEVDPAQVCDGTVWLDGVELDCGVDWTMPDPHTIELQGDACDAIKDGMTHDVEARFPCGAVEIPG